MTDHAFQTPHHQPFAIDAGGQIGVLMLHGFMGSPGELRPLAYALVEAGCSVRAPLLPGFGADLPRLARTNWREWVEAATSAWEALSAAFSQCVLIGFSMGGGIATHVAASISPDRLVLIAPFWKMADPRARVLPLVKHVMPEFKPFKAASFDNPELRHGLLQMDPSLDLDDPATVTRIREEWAIPTAALVELQRLGKETIERAPAVAAETLVIQGYADDTSTPEHTRQLVKRLGGAPRLLEIAGGHQLGSERGPSWPALRESVVAFATGGEVA
jgi:carboxylesterase